MLHILLLLPDSMQGMETVIGTNGQIPDTDLHFQDDHAIQLLRKSNRFIPVIHGIIRQLKYTIYI